MSSGSFPAIVIAAYDRPVPLSRLLNSLNNGVYPHKEVPLIISIDKSDQNKVLEEAEGFEWKHGEKRILSQDGHLGLKQHILTCGDLSQDYDSIILLEDDLLVSPFFYDYTLKALEFYKEDQNVSGISLYSYDISENGFFPFDPIDDGYDNYFLKMASSWGQCWTKSQWLSFRDWFQENPEIQEDGNLPGYLKQWSASSWKKHFVNYMNAKDKYFVFPRLSLSTNFEEEGTNAVTKGLYQVALANEPKKYKFCHLTDSYSIYDTYFEIDAQCLKKKVSQLSNIDFSTDLYGTRGAEEFQTEYALTTRQVKEYEQSWGKEMVPNILNVIYGVKGDQIKLCRAKDILSEPVSRHANFYKLQSIREALYKDILDKEIDKLHQHYNVRIEDLTKDFYKKIEDLHADYHKRMNLLHEDYIKKIDDNVKKALESLKFQLEYPKISIVTDATNAEPLALKRTIESVLEQEYPRIEYLLIKPDAPGEVQEIIDEFGDRLIQVEKTDDKEISYSSGFRKSTGDIMGWIEPGQQYAPGSFLPISRIFNKFQDITWLCGVPTSQNENGAKVSGAKLYEFRFDPLKFYSSTLKSNQESLRRPNVFWKRYLWEQSGKHLSQEHSHISDMELYSRFFKNANLHTALIYIGSGVTATENNTTANSEFESIKRSWSGSRGALSSIVSRVLYGFYKWNIPVFRSMYSDIHPIPDLVRYDYNSDAFYLSKF